MFLLLHYHRTMMVMLTAFKYQRQWWRSRIYFDTYIFENDDCILRLGSTLTFLFQFYFCFCVHNCLFFVNVTQIFLPDINNFGYLQNVICRNQWVKHMQVDPFGACAMENKTVKILGFSFNIQIQVKITIQSHLLSLIPLDHHFCFFVAFWHIFVYFYLFYYSLFYFLFPVIVSKASLFVWLSTIINA